MTDRRYALASLCLGAAARVRATSVAKPLGLRLHGVGASDFDDDAPTRPEIAADPPADADDTLHEEPAPLPPPPRASVALDSDEHLDDRLVRLRQRLGVVRPALLRLRIELARAERARGDRTLLELALADVTRALVHARRSVRATVATLAELEREASTLGERAAEILAVGRLAR